jgi:hypothetical protein
MRLRPPFLPASVRLPALPKASAWASPRRWPLRCTLLATAALLLVPSVLLVRQPRPRAEGMGRLLPHAALLQSFPAGPERAAPQLWQQRLPGPLAGQLWRQQRQLWWQFWSADGAEGAFLVLPTPRPIRIGAQNRPPNSVEVDGLLVVAPNPLALAALNQTLRAAPRQQRGLQHRCLELLERRQAAYWNGVGLGAMAGELAALLQGFQEGCVELQLATGALEFQGEAGAVAALVAPPAAGPGPGPLARGSATGGDLPPPLAPNLLLQVSGQSLEPLLSGLLRRELIREPLISAYGLKEADLKLVIDSPFVLSLRPLATGPFQAGLELVVAPRGDRQQWKRMLEGISERLLERGMQSAIDTDTSWRDADERIVGGWRWLPDKGDQPLLQLFLGPEPPPFQSTLANAKAWQALPTLRLQARPAALSALSLLPLQLPTPMQQADQLQVLAESGSEGKAGPSRLQGRLAITPRPAIRPPQQLVIPQPGLPPSGQPQPLLAPLPPLQPPQPPPLQLPVAP